MKKTLLAVARIVVAGVFLSAICMLGAHGQEAKTERGGPTSTPRTSQDTPADIAFRSAFLRDRTFCRDFADVPNEGVKAYEEFLKREDTSPEQRTFAMWGIGQLTSVGCRTDIGEIPDPQKSQAMFKAAMESLPGLICEEKINAATLYATAPGTYVERAELLAESYRFVKSFSEKDIEQSGSRINAIGFSVDIKFFPYAPNFPDLSLDTQRKKVIQRLQRGQARMEQSIAEFFPGCRDPLAASLLLDGVKDVAPPELYQKWAGTHSKFEGEFPPGEVFGELDKKPNLIERKPPENSPEKEREPAAHIAQPAPAPPAAPAGNSKFYAIAIGIAVVLLAGGACMFIIRRKKA